MWRQRGRPLFQARSDVNAFETAGSCFPQQRRRWNEGIAPQVARIHTCMYAYVYTCICVYVCVCVYMWVYVYVIALRRSKVKREPPTKGMELARFRASHGEFRTDAPIKRLTKAEIPCNKNAWLNVNYTDPKPNSVWPGVSYQYDVGIIDGNKRG